MRVGRRIEHRDQDPTHDRDDVVTSSATRTNDLRAFLENKKPAELRELLFEILKRHPQERERLQEAADLSRGATAALVRQARSELESVISEPAWRDRWRGGGSLPDYGNLRRRFENLLHAGAANALVELGRDLLRRGTRQVEASHDEGETASEIGGCMEIVFKAVPRSGLSDAEKLLFTIEILLEDEYDLCQGSAPVLAHRWSQSVWSTVADALQKRLSSQPLPDGKEWSSTSYRRDRLIERIADVLGRAGRSADIVLLYQKEVLHGGSYTRLVERLIEEKRLDEATSRAVEGIARAAPEHEGTRDRLRDLLRRIAEQKRDKIQVATWSAAAFFKHPSLASYLDLAKAARAAGCGPAVKDAALRFLETGICPPGSLTSDTRGTWPLPAISSLPGSTAVPTRGLKPGPTTPHREVLLELAFHERSPDDIIRWYDLLQAPRQNAWGRWGSSSLAVRVADAVADVYPDRRPAPHDH